MKILDTLKENKETAFMILGTVMEVGAVVLAIRNGIKAKEKLDSLPEESTTGEKALAIAPYAAPVAIMLGTSIGSFWYARKINIDKIISLGSAAAMVKMKAENQDAATKEVVTEEQYSEIQKKQVEKDIMENGYTPEKPMFDSGIPYSTIFVEKESAQPLKSTKEWIESQFLKWQNEAMRHIRSGGSEDEITCDTLYSDFFYLAKKSWMKCRGWKMSDVPRLKIKFAYPDEKPDSSVFGVPYTVFYVSEEPTDLLPFK